MLNSDQKTKRQSRLGSHLLFNLCIYFTGLMIFLLIPVYILTPEQAQLTFNNGRGARVAVDIFILAGFYFACIAILYWIFALTRFRKLGEFIVLFSFSWVVLSGLLFPLTTANGLNQLALAATKTPNLYLVLIFSGLIAMAWLLRKRALVSIFMGILISLSIVPAVYSAISTFEKRTNDDLKVQLSTQKNLILLSFDGIPGHIVSDLFDNHPEIANEFKDFTLFRNTIATAPATQLSIMGMVSGNRDATKLTDPSQESYRDYYFNDAELLNFVTGPEFSRYNVTGTALAAGQFGVPEQRAELYDVYRPVFARLFTKHGVQILDLLHYKFRRDKDGLFYLSTQGVEIITKIMDASSDKPGVFYAHFKLPHYPSAIDRDCTYRGNDRVWVAQHQNRDGIVEGAYCVLSKVQEVIRKLKSLEVYENSVIIFASDHGKPSYFYDTPPHNLMINGHKVYGVDRYLPMLLVKDAGQTQTQIKYTDRYVLLDDLAFTACRVFKNSEDCSLTPGVDILDEHSTSTDEYFIHIPKDEDAQWEIKDMKAVSLPRGIPLEKALRESGDVELTSP